MDTYIDYLIPVIAIISIFAYAVFRMYVDFLKKREAMQHFHAERMAAIEKGIKPPRAADELLCGEPADWRAALPPAHKRLRGLILLSLGVAFSLGLPGNTYWVGFLLAGWGLAYLLAGFFEAREQVPRCQDSPSGQDSYPSSRR